MTNVRVPDINKKIQQIRKVDYRRIKSRLRLRLGFEQLINRPYFNMLLCIMFIPFLVAWNNLDFFLPIEFIPEELLDPCYSIVSALLAFTLILCELVVIRTIGYFTARKFEKILSIVFSTSYDYECPIMRSCKTDRHNGLNVYEFYSEVPKSKWEDNYESIAEKKNIHFVAPRITYGGKRANNGNFIKLYTQKGILPPEREIMRDTEF